MNPSSTVSDAEAKFQQAADRFREGLKSLRTGRASAAMLDGVMVEAYGTAMPLIQVATVTAPEAQLIQITPFDPGNMAAIVSAIRDNQSLGLNPSDDGRVIRVPVPALTEERRRELAKQIGQKQEEAMIQVRAVRHEAMNVIAQLKKDKAVGEDDAKRLEKQVDDALAKTRGDIESAAKAKEQDILSL